MKHHNPLLANLAAAALVAGAALTTQAETWQMVPVTTPAASPVSRTISLGELADGLGGEWIFEPNAWFRSEPEETLTLPLPGVPTSVVQRPLVFERNDGQTAAKVAFLSRGRGYSLFLAKDEAVMVLSTPTTPGVAALQEEFGSSRVLRMRLVGANSLPAIRGEAMLPAKANYFIGNDPARWHTHVPTFGKVRYEEVYPGIGLVYYGNEGQLEYDFVVTPGADPNQIAMEFEGADGLRIREGGDLVLDVGGREMRWQKPLIYQEVNGARLEIAGQYRIRQAPDRSANLATSVHSTPSNNEIPSMRFVTFELAAYDPRLPLVIDPILVYSTYLGGGGMDSGEWVAVDANGSVYVAGRTTSTDFPIRNALSSQNAGGGNDVFVAKFTPAGELLFSTYLGGSDIDAWGDSLGMAVSPAGQCVVVGATLSLDFPLTNAVQGWFGGGPRDGFVTSLAPDGDALVFSTYLGGESADAANAVAVGLEGDIYVGGYTRSSDFPTLNAFQPALSGVSSTGFQWNDAFITRLGAGGTVIVYSTFDGQSSTAEMVTDITVAPDGSAFPALWVQDLATGGGYKWATAKFNPNGTRSFERRWPTTVTEGLSGPSIALASNELVVLTGTSWGPTLPAMNAPSPGTANGYGECYIALFSATNGAYRSAVYFGGSGNDSLSGVHVNQAGEIVVAGSTVGPGGQPSGFPVTNPLESGPAPGLSVDVFVAKFRPSDLSLTFSTLFGGPGDESPSGMALDARGNPWIVGGTGGQLPTMNPFQSQPGGENDGFLVNLSLNDLRLQISRSGQNVTLSWPVEAMNYVLETATSLPAVSWATVTNTPTVTTNERSVQLPLTGNAKFFRLRKP